MLKTASSDYLYGFASVSAALKANRRKCFKLYYSDSIKDNVDIFSIANSRNIKLISQSNRQLDQLSENRPHQGLVLHCSHLQMLRITNLSIFSQQSYSVELSKKESITITHEYPPKKFPLWVALDRIQDPVNLGAIIRSCSFFGVDGIILTERESAPLSNTVSKASVGTCESFPLFQTSNLSKFLNESSTNGWHIYGTDLNSNSKKTIPAQNAQSHLLNPTILVMGNEGDGLSSKVSSKCDQHLIIGNTIISEKNRELGLDSLNVSVSTGILLHSLLCKPSI